MTNLFTLTQTQTLFANQKHPFHILNVSPFPVLTGIFLFTLLVPLTFSLHGVYLLGLFYIELMSFNHLGFATLFWSFLPVVHRFQTVRPHLSTVKTDCTTGRLVTPKFKNIKAVRSMNLHAVLMLIQASAVLLCGDPAGAVFVLGIFAIPYAVDGVRYLYKGAKPSPVVEATAKPSPASDVPTQDTVVSATTSQDSVVSVTTSQDSPTVDEMFSAYELVIACMASGLVFAVLGVCVGFWGAKKQITKFITPVDTMRSLIASGGFTSVKAVRNISLFAAVAITIALYHAVFVDPLIISAGMVLLSIPTFLVAAKALKGDELDIESSPEVTIHAKHSVNAMFSFAEIVTAGMASGLVTLGLAFCLWFWTRTKQTTKGIPTKLTTPVDDTKALTAASNFKNTKVVQNVSQETMIITVTAMWMAIWGPMHPVVFTALILLPSVVNGYFPIPADPAVAPDIEPASTVGVISQADHGMFSASEVVITCLATSLVALGFAFCLLLWAYRKQAKEATPVSDANSPTMALTVITSEPELSPTTPAPASPELSVSEPEVPAATVTKSLWMPIWGLADCLQTEYFTSSVIYAANLISRNPAMVEVLLFGLICANLAAVATSLDNKTSKRDLAKLSWHFISWSMVIVTYVIYMQMFPWAWVSSRFGGYFAHSMEIVVFKFLVMFSASYILDASVVYMQQHNRNLLEYAAMVAYTALFMILLVAANHLMATFLTIVGFSLGLYVLILYDSDLFKAREAGLKYYFLSTLSSGLILYGQELVYMSVGTGNYDYLYFYLSVEEPTRLFTHVTLLIFAGFCFKLGAFPGHLWAADVFQGAPGPVVALLMLSVKLAVVASFSRLFTIALEPLAAEWLYLLSLIVVASIAWGAFAGVQEKKTRRLLAYASTNQMGFILMGLTTDSDDGYHAYVLYLIVYTVTTLAFLAIFLAARRADGKELTYISDFRALSAKEWVFGWSIATALFSMAGIPPLAGFFSKYAVLLHSFEKELFSQVTVGLSTSMLSVFYYLRITKTVMFESQVAAMPVFCNLNTRRRSQLVGLEIILWVFALLLPFVFYLTYGIAYSHGPALGSLASPLLLLLTRFEHQNRRSVLASAQQLQ